MRVSSRKVMVPPFLEVFGKEILTEEIPHCFCTEQEMLDPLSVAMIRL